MLSQPYVESIESTCVDSQTYLTCVSILIVSADEVLCELTGIFDQRRVQREGCQVNVSNSAS
jgi:hypothetical protein